ncbi:class D sortase [Sediminibacillus albus]|uniref:Sortase A n=1 Tax=Sediminibacillus albus TaxID=407036 RepID=A0A1G8YBK7_9BACI|nr:class D sortase [Sediminibacillus albus]SDK00053.1 sortase A [Sediminibacillus albus]
MRGKIGVFLLAVGFFLAGWNSYSWWKQTNVVISSKGMTQSMAANWSDIDEKEAAIQPTKKSYSFTHSEYPKDQLQAGQKIGYLDIPKLESVYPAFWGTDKQTLKQGVGMYNSAATTLPTEAGHTALAGHRDTVFAGVDKLQPGDKIYLRFENHKYEYEIKKTSVTNADDRTVLTKKESPTLTLTTCYPFDFIGSAPERYIVQAKLTGTKAVEKIRF